MSPENRASHRSIRIHMSLLFPFCFLALERKCTFLRDTQCLYGMAFRRRSVIVGTTNPSQLREPIDQLLEIRIRNHTVCFSPAIVLNYQKLIMAERASLRHGKKTCKRGTGFNQRRCARIRTMRNEN